MQVWIVTSGCYSNTHLQGVFSDPTKAESIAALMDDGRVHGPWELDQFNKSLAPAGLECFHVEMCHDGKVMRCEKYALLDSSGALWNTRWHLFAPGWDPSVARVRHWRLEVTVYVKDESHAVKIANEVRAQLLAGHFQPNNYDQYSGDLA